MKKITQSFVERLEAPKEGSRIEWDGQVSGFGIRVTSAGVKSFVLQYVSPLTGKDRRYTIGRWQEWSADAARNEALELRKRIRQDDYDPLEKPTLADGELTVADLAREYLASAEKKKRPSSVRNDKSMNSNIIVPAIGQLSAKTIGQREIEALHNSLKPTPYRANRVLSLLSAMFTQAIKWEVRSENPCKGIQRYAENKREAWLSREQLIELDKALTAYGADSDAAEVIRLLILTGSRLREVMQAKWDQFDLKRGIWTKPSHSTKEKKTEHIPLSPPSLEVLDRLEKRRNGSPFVFPGNDTKKARTSVRRVWVAACKTAGLATPYTIQGKRKELTRYRPVVRLHDLRHSFASNAVNAGKSLAIIGKVLGHCRPETTQRYAHVNDAAMRDVVNDIGSMLHPPVEVAPPPAVAKAESVKPKRKRRAA